MPVFDLALQRICVRVVYDGVAGSGKTTNVRHLCGTFVTQRRGEMYSPEELHGRTLYFDWVEITAGVVCGSPLICQVVSVPGQAVLSARRRHLLSSADVIVYVCDSAESAMDRAREGLDLVKEVMASRPTSVPLIVQANKQDQESALDGAAVLNALGFRDADGVVVEAIATDGIGVVDTFISAVRSSARDIQKKVEAGLLRVPVRPVEKASELLSQLTSQELDGEWASEMLLEEASRAFSWVEEAVQPSEARGEKVPSSLPAPLTPPPPATPPAPPSPGASGVVRVASVVEFPELPRDSVPTGFVWPAHTGREALRALAPLLPASPTIAIGDGGAAVHVAGDWVLRTKTSLRFTDAEAARHALVRTARWKAQLGNLLLPDTVLVVQPGAAGVHWLWTISPKVEPASETLAALDDDRARDDVVAKLAIGIVDALVCAAHHALPIELTPSCFAVGHGAMRYIGDIDDGPRDGIAGLGPSLLEAASMVEASGGDVALFVNTLGRTIVGRLTREDDERLGLSGSLRGASPQSSSALLARTRLLEALAEIVRAA